MAARTQLFSTPLRATSVRARRPQLQAERERAVPRPSRPSSTSWSAGRCAMRMRASSLAASRTVLSTK